MAETPVRILIVSDKFAPTVGGTAAVAEALARNLPACVLVAAPAVAGYPEVDYDRRFDFPVHRVRSFGIALPRSIPPRLRGPLQFAFNQLWTRPRAIASLVRFLTAHPVDVVCINTLVSYWVAAGLRRRWPRLKVVFYLHGEEIAGAPARRGLGKLAQEELLRGDAVVTVSSFTRDLAVARGVPPDRITVISNGVDTVRFTPGAKDPELMQRFGLEGRRVLLCLARLDERKGQDSLLRAMPGILAAVPGTVLLLVGAGPWEPRLRALAESLALGEAVVFAGMATDDEVARFYRTADVYAMPNRTTDCGDTEGFGLVFLEAGACAIPVIGGRAGGVPDAILDGTTGFLVDGLDTAEIARAAIRLLGDPELARTLGRNGYDHALDHTWHGQAQKFQQLCAGLVGRE